jgi:hypothetical protein
MDLKAFKGSVIGSVLSAKDDPDLMMQWLDKALPIVSTDAVIRTNLWAKIEAVMGSSVLRDLKGYVDNNVPPVPPTPTHV